MRRQERRAPGLRSLLRHVQPQLLQREVERRRQGRADGQDAGRVHDLHRGQQDAGLDQGRRRGRAHTPALLRLRRAPRAAPPVRFIAEPGRFFVSAATSAVTSVYARKGLCTPMTPSDAATAGDTPGQHQDEKRQSMCKAQCHKALKLNVRHLPLGSPKVRHLDRGFCTAAIR